MSLLEPLASPHSLPPLLLTRPDEVTPAAVRRVVGLPEEEDAFAKNQGSLKAAAVSPVAEMFRPVGLLLHSQSVPCFGNYENVSHLDATSKTAGKTATETGVSTAAGVSGSRPNEIRAARRLHPKSAAELRKRELLLYCH